MKKSFVSVPNRLNAGLDEVTTLFGGTCFAESSAARLDSLKPSSGSDNFWYIGINPSPPQSPKNNSGSLNWSTEFVNATFNSKSANQYSKARHVVEKKKIQIITRPPEAPAQTSASTRCDSYLFWDIETPRVSPSGSRDVSPYVSREPSRENLLLTKPMVKSEPIAIPSKKPLSPRW